MLISHRHRFIFIKTVKTAGTSVEGFLEPFCCPPGHVVQHWTPTLMFEEGVVGQRWPPNDRENYGYYNHMPASEIRQRCSFFDAYTRITTVRNPYDRAVSYFHYEHETFRPQGGMSLSDAIRLVGDGKKQELQQRFLDFVVHGLPDDEQLLTIEGALAVDRWIRYESLVADLEELVKDLPLPLQGSVADALPGFKRNRHGRLDVPDIIDYLTPKSIELINQQSRWSFCQFGYSQIDPHSLPQCQ